jgi:hypothetical protein
MGSVLPFSAEIRWSGETKDYKTVTCCFFSKHTTLKSKIKRLLVISESGICVNISMRGLLCQCAYTIQIQLSVFV